MNQLQSTFVVFLISLYYSNTNKQYENLCWLITHGIYQFRGLLSCCITSYHIS